MTWDVEGWVKAALCHWANECDEDRVQIGRRTVAGKSWITIYVDSLPIADVTVRKNLTPRS